MEGLGIVIIILLLLYFLSFFFTFLVLGRLFKVRPAAGFIIAMIGIAALLTAIIFWTELYIHIGLGIVLIYFVIIVAIYIVYAGFFGLNKKKD